MGQLTVTNNLNPDQEETLRISSKNHISAVLQVFRFVDKDTHQVILYVQSLELSGYGETEEKANEMLDDAIDQYFEFLTSLSLKERTGELNKLGWHRDKLHNKVFSKAYVDPDGNLKNFNAVGNKVERLTLETA